jgi:hypothetical protein
MISSDGQRTMRTCLGQHSTRQELICLRLPCEAHLLHCEGYRTSQVLASCAMACAPRPSSVLDLASFEVIRTVETR